MPHIDYYFGVLSPWSYLAGLRMEEIAARHGASVTYKPVDMPQLFDRTGGIRRENRAPQRLAYTAQDLPRWAAKLQMPLHSAPRFRGANAAPAAYAIIAAQVAGGGDVGGLVHGLMSAVWVEDRDISDDTVIEEKLSAHGFDPKIAFSALLTGAEIYSRNLQQAVDAGAFGSPFYIVTDSDQRFWGQDHLGFLDEHLATLA
ncbi:2-hydroxychromene-2-carboxylate isomerase [Paracoccus aminophilus]|uniref:2-hydroxychromene-2-carboxylate isomerase n=1 Tax=Paracoccus aminophilus JCM 7686 TaxID=1367847 RepID=S5YVH6_PARAH|nr:2-hydroxychromene-2-carboxylate isomerase [Paracoccus aminophilus]AGT09226.1 DsbA oxidoreductase [Paracoccus aminophilus JCM 7686]